MFVKQPPQGAAKQPEGFMRVLLLLNGPREHYVGGADIARQIKWREYCSPTTDLEIGYLPSAEESGGGANNSCQPSMR
jgi:hypothetical protein